MKTSKSETGPSPNNLLNPADFELIFTQAASRSIIFRTDDPDFTCVAVTDLHLALTGKKREDIIGKKFFDIFPDVSEESKKAGKSLLAESFRRLIRTKKPLHETMRYDIPDASGVFHEHYWEVTHHPILDSTGKVAYILQTSEDITPVVVAQRSAKDIRTQLQEALDIGKVGSWVWDVEADVIVADKNIARFFGASPKELAKGASVDIIRGRIHPDDLQRVLSELNKSLKQHTIFEQEYRVLSSSGKVRWLWVRGKLEKRADGKSIFPGVMVDVTERRDLLAQVELARQQDRLNQQAAKILQRRNEELEQISRSKDEFVALASHQLRTPATAVKQYLGMVLQGYVGDITDIQQEMLSKAFESNERQIEIINQILNAARVDTGRLMLSQANIDLNSLVQNIVADLRPGMEQHHTVSVNLPTAACMITADRGYLRMAIENILDNACLYTPAEGSIAVRLSRQGKRCLLSISDTGVGIRKADLTKLFVKFSRIHNPLSVQAGGSGIGLYLAAEIIKLHGGTIAVDSKIGKGTTFAISLPVVQNEVKSGGEVIAHVGTEIRA